MQGGHRRAVQFFHGGDRRASLFVHGGDRGATIISLNIRWTLAVSFEQMDC